MEVDLPDSKMSGQTMICPLAAQRDSLHQIDTFNNNEIDINAIFKVLFIRRYFIVAIALISAILGVIYATSLPNVFTSVVLVVPNKKYISSGGTAKPLGNLGGLASIFGVNVESEQGFETDLYLATMHTRTFAKYTIQQFNLLPLLSAEINKRRPGAVTMDDAADMLLGNEVITKGGKDFAMGSRIQFSSSSPELCVSIAETLVKSINRFSQLKAIEMAKKDIAMANAQLQQTTTENMRQVLWSIISAKTKEIVLAEAQDDFVFRIIEPAITPKKRISPNRNLIVIGFAGAGLLIGVVAALAREFVSKGNVFSNLVKNQ